MRPRYCCHAAPGARRDARRFAVLSDGGGIMLR